MFFQRFSGIKVKFVDKMVQSNYFCYFYMQKLYSSRFYLNWIFDKIQDGCQDGDHVWWRHRPPAAPPPIKYTSSCREKMKGFPLRAKSFRNTAIYQKLKERGGGFNQPPLYHGGVWLCVYIRGLMHPSIALIRLLFLMNESAGHWGETEGHY